ncbi:MAG: hypothetical protein M1503_09900 [Thaumarchaeota archaeon]|nr:hypothetical protein [Nitrososphaerota archaeon]MCL5318553.1 hypothetical protein [Nitrososphaerota archaeon]
MTRATLIELQPPRATFRKASIWIQLPAGAAFTWLTTFILLNQLNISFRVLMRNKGLVNQTVQLNIISPYIDNTIWLVTLALIIITFLLQSPIQSIAEDSRIRLAAFLFTIALTAYLAELQVPAQILATAAALIILAISLSGTAKTHSVSRRKVATIFALLWLLPPLTIEMFTAARWIISGFDGQLYSADSSWSLAVLDLQMTNSLQPILPRLFVLFAAIIPLTILFTPYEKLAKTLAAKILKPNPRSDPSGSDGSVKLARMILAVSVAATVFISSYPYLPAVNPQSKMVSVDAKYYYAMMQTTTRVDALTALGTISHHDHMFYLIVQQVVATLTGSVDITIRIMPPILAALLTISTYFMVAAYSRNRFLAAVAALFTAASFQVIAGINAGFYANWLALSEMNIFLILFLKAVERGEKFSGYSILSAGLAIVILFTHSATWTVMMAGLLTYTAISAAAKTLKRCELVIITQIVALNILSELLKTNLLHNQSTALQAASMTPHISYSNLLIVYQNLGTTFSYFLGGAYANPLIIILATIGLAQIVKSRQKLHQILLSFTIVCILGTFFTSSVMPELFQSRFIYLIPFQILAAFGFNSVLNLSNRVFTEKAGRIGWAVPVMLQIIVFSQLLSYALRVVGFVYTV